MFSYIIYNSLVQSDLVFAQLVPYDGTYEPTDLPISISEAKIGENYEALTNNGVYISDDYSYLSNKACKILVSEKMKIHYEKKTDLSDSLLQSYILGFGMAFLFHQRNMLPIHCSCVANENGAVLLSGPSGTGKSTLTTILLEHGYHLMADDMAVVDVLKKEPLVAPAFPYQKLCRDVVMEKKLPLDQLIYIDEEKDKYLVPVNGTFHPAPVPVKSIIMLTQNATDRVLAEEIMGIGRFHACMDTLFIGPWLGQNLYQPEIGKLGLTLASKIRVFHLSRPYGIESLEQMSEALGYYISEINRK